MSEQNRLARRRNKRLMDELTRQGRSLKWFCQQMGCSRYTVWRIETGDSGAPVDWYPRAARILGVPDHVVAPAQTVAQLRPADEAEAVA